MNDIKKLEKLVEHKNDYDLAFGTKIHRPYVMYDEDWEVLEDIIVRIKDLEQIEKEHKEENGRLREETDKKDKIIYNLAFALADYVMYYEYDKCRNPEMIKNKAKEKIEYFTNKVEEDK